jgi:hypothetical protein
MNRVPALFSGLHALLSHFFGMFSAQPSHIQQGLRGSLPWWSEDSCRTDHVREFVNRFPADRRKVEVSLFSVVFETASAARKQ